jgi:hypothetical protein
MPISAAQLVALGKLALEHPRDEKHWQKLLDSGVFADAMKADLDVTDRAVWRKSLGLAANPNHSTLKRAKEILCNEMMTHEDVDTHFEGTRLQLTEEEFVGFKAGVPWNDKLLFKGKENGYFLLPIRTLSIADLCDCFPACFSPSSIKQYGDEKFFNSKYENPVSNWLFIKQGDESTLRFRTWDEQVRWCPAFDRLPTAFEVVYAAVMREQTGRSALITQGRTIRCMDMTSKGRTVIVGQAANSDRIIIGSTEPHERSGGITSTVCMKPLA